NCRRYSINKAEVIQLAENKIHNFSDMELDAIGEILNISLGSSATSVSELLEKPVNITTPIVKVMRTDDFSFTTYEPAIGVEINYVQGLSGKNIMILKESDIKIIVGLLLQTDYSKEEFVMDEMSIGAICEVMNQMMGAASTALANFLNRQVNISPPNSFAIDNTQEFKAKYFDDEDIVAVYFNLMIGDLINSEFINVMPVNLAKDLISVFNLDSEPEVEAMPQASAPSQAAINQEEEINIEEIMHKAEMETEQMKEAPRAAAAMPNPNKTREPTKTMVQHNISQNVYSSFDNDTAIYAPAEGNNLNLIMSVPLQVTVEIGRTTKKIKDILDLSTGMVVELDKQAGSQVDVFVNGQVIAKGDVVVVDDLYGVRITEITNNEAIMKAL
ncbi:MAG: flagellar motor switch phosphatase FliY, partial [Clostridia bacterium]|nr:flagellar motor switch phosphatase FliY [Clostridia bacterium]